MTVKDFIEELQKFNPDAEIQTITVGNMNEWDRTNEPKVKTHKNMFGEWVFVE